MRPLEGTFVLTEEQKRKEDITRGRVQDEQDNYRLWYERIVSRNEEDIDESFQDGRFENDPNDFSNDEMVSFLHSVRDGVLVSIQEDVDFGRLPKETGNEVQEKIEIMLAEIKNKFEEWTCIFDGAKYQISDELFEKIDDAFPGLNSKSYLISLNTKGIIIINMAGEVLHRFSVSDFYEAFMKKTA